MILDGWAAEHFKNDTTGGNAKSETINPPKMTGWVCPCKNTSKGWEVTC